jgi:hypothetical protein
MRYDPERWVDVAPNVEGASYCSDHILQSTAIDSCTLRDQGPSDHNGLTQPVEVAFDGIQYTVITLREPETEPGQVSARYMAQGVIRGYSDEHGSPLLILQAERRVWDECQHEAAPVLGTLRAP